MKLAAIILLMAFLGCQPKPQAAPQDDGARASQGHPEHGQGR